MRWKKLGHVYVANGQYPWAQTHAYIPTPVILNDKIIRVYVAFLDKDKVGRIGFVDVEKANPLKVLSVSKKPVLDIGEPGTFDDNGVTPLCILNIKNDQCLYYVGWQKCVKIPYQLFVGLAVKKGEKFQRYAKVPILERSDEERFIRTASCVIKDSRRFKMWYIAGNKWFNHHRKMLPVYNLRYLESNDGFTWGRSGTICLTTKKDEIGFGRPYIIKEHGSYKMWYSIRTIAGYKYLGYAESQDGFHWERKDDSIGITPSKEGWDSQMIGFSSIIDIGHKRYMFYNGNRHGETGFGVAVLEN